MFLWTFDGDPTVMARTVTEAGLTSEWVAMRLPVAESAADPEPSMSAAKKVSSPTAPAGSARGKSPSLMGENPSSIIRLEALSPALTDEGMPGSPVGPSDMPTPGASPSTMPVTPMSPAASAEPSAGTGDESSPSPPVSAPESGEEACTDGREGNNKCQGKGSGEHPNGHEDKSGKGGQSAGQESDGDGDD